MILWKSAKSKKCNFQRWKIWWKKKKLEKDRRYLDVCFRNLCPEPRIWVIIVRMGLKIYWEGRVFLKTERITNWVVQLGGWVWIMAILIISTVGAEAIYNNKTVPKIKEYSRNL